MKPSQSRSVSGEHTGDGSSEPTSCRAARWKGANEIVRWPPCATGASPVGPPNHHYRLTLSVEGLEIPVVGVQPAVLAAGGLAHDVELLKMLERAAGLKSSVWGIKWGGGDGDQRLGLSARSNGWLPPGRRKRQEIELAGVHEYVIVHVAVNMTHTLNMPSHSQAALENMLGAQLHQLLRRIPWLSGVQVETNPAAFDRAFDLMAHFQVPRGPRIELWVECKLDPRPSQFPYVTLEREFEARTVKRVKVPVFAAPYVSPRMAEICESHGWELVRPGGKLPDHRAGPLSSGAGRKACCVAAPQADRESGHAGSGAGRAGPVAAGAWGDALDPAADGGTLSGNCPNGSLNSLRCPSRAWGW